MVGPLPGLGGIPSCLLSFVVTSTKHFCLLHRDVDLAATPERNEFYEDMIRSCNCYDLI
jgi:hypothetical protein